MVGNGKGQMGAWVRMIVVAVMMFCSTVVRAQWGFDVTSVEAYINDHKKQRSLLLARSTLEYSNKLLHDYSKKETVGYKELNVDLDKYTRAFDVIDVMYQSLRTALNAKGTYETVSERIGDYKRLLEDFNDKVVKRKHIELADTMLLSINAKAIKLIAADGEQLYKSVSDLVLYATGAAACSTSDLLMVLEAVNTSLDNIERHLNHAYFETWRYVQVRMGYWKEKVYRDYLTEKKYAEEFIEEGCVIISQHSDTTGPATACEATDSDTPVYIVSYNESMTNVAPTTYLTGCRINWEPYVAGAVESVLKDKKIEENVRGNVIASTAKMMKEWYAFIILLSILLFYSALS